MQEISEPRLHLLAGAGRVVGCACASGLGGHVIDLDEHRAASGHRELQVVGHLGAHSTRTGRWL